MSAEESEELPEGWAWAKLGELGHWAGGGTPTTRVAAYWKNGTIPWISAKDMKADYLGASQDFISEEGREAARLTLLPPGTVLMVVRGMILARRFPVAVITAPATINQDLRALVPSPIVEPRFLLRALQLISRDVVHATGESTHGTRRLESDTLKAWPIAIPPLAEQRRIVFAVERILEKVSSARERLERMPVTLKRFRQAVLSAACSGRLTADWRAWHYGKSAAPVDELPPFWRRAKLGEVIDGLKYGTSKKSDYASKGVPVLGIPNIGEGKVTHNDIKYAELEPSELEQLRLRPGDVLMIRSNGSVSLLGKSALVSERENNCAYAGYLIRIRPKMSEIYPSYLNSALASEEVRDQIEIPARSTSGVNNINSDEVRALLIPLPPMAEQEEIVRRVSEFFLLADTIEQRPKSALRRVEMLTQSILVKAFRGELVPTEAELARRENRSYEPASELLARLKNSTSGEIKQPRAKRSSKGNPVSVRLFGQE